MRILCVFGACQYGDPARGAGIEAVNFIPALVADGHEVRLVDSWDRSGGRTASDVNRELLSVAEAWRPDLLISVLMDVEIWSETLLAVRTLGTRAVSWAADDTWKWRQVSRFVAADYDGMVTTYEGAIPAYQQLGAPVLLSQWAASHTTASEPIPAAQCRYGVSFVGMAYGDRQRLVAAVQRDGIEVTCFGHHWPAGSVAHERIPEIIRESQITLNFSKGLYGGPNQIKARVFEVPGAGGFLLTEEAPGLSRWYDIGREIDVFSDAAALVERVRYYLAHPEVRDDCALAAARRTREEHTYRLRLRAVVAFASSLPKPAPTATALPGAVLVARHRPSPILEAVRQVLVAACRLLWGRQRARSAARRIAFELSWRLSGRSTFSAAGWFGRMFP